MSMVHPFPSSHSTEVVTSHSDVAGLHSLSAQRSETHSIGRSKHPSPDMQPAMKQALVAHSGSLSYWRGPGEMISCSASSPGAARP